MANDEDSDADSIPLSDLRSDIEGDDTDRDKTDPSGDERSPDRDRDRDSPEEGEDETAGSIPLSGLKDEVDREFEDKSEQADAVGAGAFVEEDVEEVDSEGVWADLLMESESPEGQFEATAIEEGAEGTTQVISKRICERCRYLDAPPTLQCTHEGTTIHELVDVDTVRVSQCPMVGPEGEEAAKGPARADQT